MSGSFFENRPSVLPKQLWRLEMAKTLAQEIAKELLTRKGTHLVGEIVEGMNRLYGIALGQNRMLQAKVLKVQEAFRTGHWQRLYAEQKPYSCNKIWIV